MSTLAKAVRRQILMEGPQIADARERVLYVEQILDAMDAVELLDRISAALDAMLQKDTKG